MYSEIVERQSELDLLFIQAKQLQVQRSADVSVRAAFESYLCIRTYAFVEASVRIILLRYVRRIAGDGSIESYVASQLKRHRNLKYSELIKLLRSFDPEWANGISDRTDTITRTALNALVSLRNNISHGDDVVISLRDLQSYFESSQEIVRLVFETCEPAGALTTDG